MLDNVLFFILIQSELERPSRVTHKAKAGGLISGDPRAAGRFDLTQVEGEAADYDWCDAVSVECEIMLVSRQRGALTWSKADLKDPS